MLLLITQLPALRTDDLLRGYGVGLKRQSIFADGFLSFQQNGNDSVLVFDAYGANQQAKSDTALLVFKGVQASAFSRDHLDSVLIDQDDFLLNQEQQQTALAGNAVNTPIDDESFEPALEGQPMTNIEVDPITGVGTDQPLANGAVETASAPSTPATSNPTNEGMEANQPLTNATLDLATAGLEAPVTLSPLPELEAGPAVSTPAVETSAESFNPVAASPSISGPDASPALSSAAAPTDLV